MFTTGKYLTVIGHKAVVAQLRCPDKNNWILRGAIEYGGAWYMHSWTLEGKCRLGFQQFNLVQNS